jgi:hypothetical protein
VTRALEESSRSRKLALERPFILRRCERTISLAFAREQRLRALMQRRAVLARLAHAYELRPEKCEQFGLDSSSVHRLMRIICPSMEWAVYDASDHTAVGSSAAVVVEMND